MYCHVCRRVAEVTPDGRKLACTIQPLSNDEGGFEPAVGDTARGSLQEESAAPVASCEPIPPPTCDMGFPACVTLKLLRDIPFVEPYKLGDLLGEGSFGQVFSATKPGSTQEFAVKIFKSDCKVSAMEEAIVLEKCANHPCIVQLLDAASVPGRGCCQHKLVFERWGRDLAATFRQKQSSGELDRGFGPVQLRRIVSDVASGLAHLNHIGLIHADLKPQNVLAKHDVDGGCFACKLADLGSCVEVASATT